MSKIIFTMTQINQLEENPNVASVSERSIQYTTKFKFKVRAVRENMEGKGPQQIFTEAGFDLTVIGKRKAHSALIRWRKTYRKDGEEGLRNDKRGKALGGGRPKTYRCEPSVVSKTLGNNRTCLRRREREAWHALDPLPRSEKNDASSDAYFHCPKPQKACELVLGFLSESTFH